MARGDNVRHFLRRQKGMDSQLKDSQLTNKVKDYIAEHELAPEGARILVGLSGGADSMCLAAVLREIGLWDVQAVHVHHGLRENADEDMRFVREWCGQNGITLHTVKVDAAGFAKKAGMGLEEAARILRYRAISERAAQWDAEAAGPEAAGPEAASPEAAGHCKIAVAHHIEDQAETVLFHLIRGSRLKGACGMQPAAEVKAPRADAPPASALQDDAPRASALQDDAPLVDSRQDDYTMHIIRPLLGCTKEEILSFLEERGIGWREDETNADPNYSRNYLRTKVIPQLEELNPQAQVHIAEFAQEAAETEAFLQRETELAILRCRAEGGAGRIHISKLLEEPPIVQRRIVHTLIAGATGTAKDLQARHVAAVLELASSCGNGELHMPAGGKVVKRYNELIFVGRMLQQGLQAESEPEQPQKELQLQKEQQPEPEAEHQQQGMKAEPQPEVEPEPQPRSTGGGARYPLGAEEYEAAVFEAAAPMDAIPQNEYTKWFDYDKIFSFPEFRTRRPGDRIVLSGEGSSKKVARYMIDAKIPREYRDRIVFPAVGSDALWIPGGRISAAFMVDEGTRKILQIRWLPGIRLEGETSNE